MLSPRLRVARNLSLLVVGGSVAMFAAGAGAQEKYYPGVGGHTGTAKEGFKGRPKARYDIAGGKTAILRTCHWRSGFNIKTRDHDTQYADCVAKNAEAVGGIDKLISDPGRRQFYRLRKLRQKTP